jgi:serine/threonine protein kinase
MRNTLENLVGGLTPAQNNAVVPDALKQISAMMKFLQKELYFNHRDMKGDNIMYDRAPDGRGRVMRFIDFGMSCITWAGMKISGSTWFDVKHTCFKKDRDMSQLVYYIQHYLGSKLSAPLLNRLQLIIRANVGARHKCEMAKLCPARGLKEWRNTYNFLDRENVRVPAGTPEFIETNMQKFLEGKPFESPPKDPVGICPPGKIRNPKTGRCVKNKSTPLVGNVGPAAPCPPDKIFNPRTRRCVKKTGAVGRLLAVTRRSRRRN